MSLRIVIIEDEKLTAQDLATTIVAINNQAEIIRVINSVEDGIAFFTENKNVDLIFADIQLGDGKSFKIFEQSSLFIPIIFCTAYDEYAIKAFETNSIDYILKPFSKQTVGKALEKYNLIHQKTNTSIDNSGMDYNNSLIVYQAEKIIKINEADIALFFIENDAIKLLDIKGNKFLLNFRLDELEQKYTLNFYRVNRQFLVHKKAIKNAEHIENRKLQIHLNIDFDNKIIVGKEKVTNFLNWFSL
jgi:two-component system, LytTR family, response regulator LytT